MQQQQPPSSLDHSPSFNSYSSNNLATALNDLNINQNDGVDEHRDHHVPDDDDSEFEFAVVGHDGEFEFPITADEIFSQGQIRPLFPHSESDRDARVSDPTDHDNQIRIPLKKLLIEERDFSCSSSEVDDEIDLESLPPGTYCVWTPKKNNNNQEDKIMMSKKSKSAGESSSRRRRLREFLLRRSTSDGTGESVVFVAPPPKKAEKSTTEKSTVAVVRGDVARYMEERAAARESDRRKTYLPYRRDVVGIFGSVNGFGSRLL